MDILAQSPELRSITFGEVPLDAWGINANNAEEPWASFSLARERLRQNDRAGAIAALTTILETRGIESRQSLEVWRALRSLGVHPQDQAQHLYGVVIEVGFELGTDTVAAYEDGTARYYNQGGSAIVFERDEEPIGSAVRDLLRTATHIVARAGTWDKELPSQPKEGDTRITALTAAGIRFGQGSFAALSSDRVTRPVLQSAFALVKLLMARAKPAGR